MNVKVIGLAQSPVIIAHTCTVTCMCIRTVIYTAGGYGRLYIQIPIVFDRILNHPELCNKAMADCYSHNKGYRIIYCTCTIASCGSKFMTIPST